MRMNEWLFFGSFAALLVLNEFVSRRVAASVAARTPGVKQGPGLTPGQRLFVRLFTVGWYGLVIWATTAYWLGSNSAAGALGWFFGVTATLTLCNGVFWIFNRN
jgi:hypothetical protein